VLVVVVSVAIMEVEIIAAIVLAAAAGGADVRGAVDVAVSRWDGEGLHGKDAVIGRGIEHGRCRGRRRRRCLRCGSASVRLHGGGERRSGGRDGDARRGGAVVLVVARIEGGTSLCARGMALSLDVHEGLVAAVAANVGG